MSFFSPESLYGPLQEHLDGRKSSIRFNHFPSIDVVVIVGFVFPPDTHSAPSVETGGGGGGGGVFHTEPG